MNSARSLSHAPRATRVDDVDLAWLRDRREAWTALASEAWRPTPFYAPHVLLAHAENGLSGNLRALVVRDGERFIAVLPYRPAGTRFGWRKANSAWQSAYTPSADPLVAADAIEPGMRGLADGLAAASGRFWILPQLTLTGRVGLALRAEIDGRGWASAVLQPFARPVLERGATYESYRGAQGRDRRRSLSRRRRRLEEIGGLVLRSADRGPGLTDAVESFLVLEGGGWKGRRGTAMASRPAHAALARALFAAEPGGPVEARADLLCLDDRPIAASLALVSGGTAYLLKLAYDEAYARFAPGLLLEDEIIRALHETGFAQRLNSCATAESHLDALYPDRDGVGDLAFVTDPGIGKAGIERLVQVEQGRRRVRALGARAFWAASGALARRSKP